MLPSLRVAAVFIGALLLLAAPVHAQSDVLDLAEAAQLLRLPASTIEQLARDGRLPGRQLAGQWRFSRSALLAWLGQHETSPATLPPAALPPALPSAQLARVTGRQQASAKSAPLGEQPAAPSAESIALRDQGGLLRRGTATVEFGASYSRSEQSLFPVVRVETQTTTAAAILRYVPFDGVQVGARLPYVWQRSTQFTDASAGTPAVRTIRQEDRGDAGVSVLAQVLREGFGRPNILIGFDGVSAADSTRSHGAGVSALLTKSADPAVLFFGMSYMRGLDAERIDNRSGLARNNFAVNLGYTYALNDGVALNALFAGSYRSYRANPAGTPPPPREGYVLQFGATWLLARGLFVEPAVAVRIGGDRPDMTFSLNLPWTF